MTSLYPPLNLPFKHNSIKGVPVPFFIKQERFDEIKEKHKSRPGDILISSYPKSGTTWLQNIVNLLCDEPQGKDLDLYKATPWITANPQEEIDNLNSPRIFKSHAKFSWLPECTINNDVKIITCYRNPKDQAVSFYHHTQFFDKIYGGISGYTFDQYFDEIVSKDNAEYGNVVNFMSEWFEQKDRRNLLILCYEDMVEDLEREVRKIVSFLGLEMSEEALLNVVERSTFSSMKKNDKVNKMATGASTLQHGREFIRKGKVGDWKDTLSKEQSEFFDEMMRDERVERLGIKVRYEL